MKILVRIFTVCFLVVILTSQMGMEANASTRIPGLPPSEQTSYKLYCRYSTSVGTVKKRANDLVYVGNIAMGLGTVFSKPIPTLGYVVGVTGSVISIYGNAVTRSLSKFKDNSRYVVTQYFRWKTSKKNDYRAYLKTKVYVEYKGKIRITNIKKQTELIDFGDIE